MDPEAIDEIKRHFGVVAEGLRADVSAVAEGVQALGARLDDFRRETKADFQEVKAMIRFSYAELDRRIRALETDVGELRARLERVESRVAG